jgi:hypothetical protein
MKKKTSVATGATKTRRKDIDPVYAIAILKTFYHEAKKEFKKLEKISTKMVADKDICSLYFSADGFTLSLSIKEGGML